MSEGFKVFVGLLVLFLLRCCRGKFIFIPFEQCLTNAEPYEVMRVTSPKWIQVLWWKCWAEYCKRERCEGSLAVGLGGY